MPKLFSERDPKRMHALIEENSFGMLIVPDGRGGVEIAHLPFLLDPSRGPYGRLYAHVAKANPIWKLSVESGSALAVFSGPHGYISPRWYENPREQVPTWNYAVVHAHGRVEGPKSHDELLALLDKLAEYHERGVPEPWRVEGVDPTLRERLLEEIVGIELSVIRLEGKFKLSQNRSPTDQALVLAALRARGEKNDLAMATLMAARSTSQ